MRDSNRVLAWIATLVLSAGNPALAQLAEPNLISDPTFDGQAASVSDFCYLNYNCPTGAWVGSLSGFVHANTVNFAVGSIPGGNHAMFLQGPGGFAASFSAPSAGRYRMAWYAAGRSAPPNGGFDGNQTYDIILDEHTAPVVLASGRVATSSSFKRYNSASFELSAGYHTLTFQGRAQGDSTAYFGLIVLARENETTSYSYDALGRLVGISRTGVVTGGQTTTITLDAADNRTRVTTSGVAP